MEGERAGASRKEERERKSGERKKEERERGRGRERERERERGAEEEEGWRGTRHKHMFGTKSTSWLDGFVRSISALSSPPKSKGKATTTTAPPPTTTKHEATDIKAKARNAPASSSSPMTPRTTPSSSLSPSPPSSVSPAHVDVHEASARETRGSSKRKRRRENEEKTDGREEKKTRAPLARKVKVKVNVSPSTQNRRVSHATAEPARANCAAHGAAAADEGGDQEEWCKVIEVKNRVFTKQDNDLSNVCDWVRHLAKSPHSALMDYKNLDEDVYKVKQALQRLRLVRQEGMLNRRKGLRPPSMAALTLVRPYQSTGAVNRGEEGDGHFPRRISRVGEAYQASIPEVLSSPETSDREEPLCVWPLSGLQESKLLSKGCKAVDALSLLTDPVNYDWSREEYKAFKSGLQTHGKDFASISNVIGKCEGNKTPKQCVAFYYQVWKTLQKPR